MSLPRLTADMTLISDLSNRPNSKGKEGLSAAELKALFDAAPEAIKDYINNTLIPQIESDINAAALGVGTGGAISGSAIADNGITTSKLADKSVTNAKLADGAVSTVKIGDGAVTAAKIYNGAVTKDKIGSGAVTPDKIGSGAVTADKIFTGSVTEAKLGTGAVTTDKIGSGAVTTAKLYDNAVTREKLAHDALYSPITNVTGNTTLSQNHLGRTLSAKWSSTDVTHTITLDGAASSAIRDGFEVGLVRLWSYAKMRIAFSDIRLIYNDEQVVSKNTSKTFELNRGAMVALKKFETAPTTGDVWLLTGNVEVVS